MISLFYNLDKGDVYSMKNFISQHLKRIIIFLFIINSFVILSLYNSPYFIPIEMMILALILLVFLSADDKRTQKQKIVLFFVTLLIVLFILLLLINYY